MPIELNNTLKNSCSWSFASQGMNKLFMGRFSSAGVLSVVIIVLIMIMYPGQKNTPLWVLVKLGIYVFIASVSVIFVHDCVSNKFLEDKTNSEESHKFITSIGENVGDPDNVDIKPTITGGEDGSEAEIEPVGGDSEATKLFSMYGV